MPVIATRLGSAVLLLACVAGAVVCEPRVTIDAVEALDPRCNERPPDPCINGVCHNSILNTGYFLDWDRRSCRVWKATQMPDEPEPPFESREECRLVCLDRIPCGPETPCESDDRTCVWLPEEGRGYCAYQCEKPPPLERDFDWYEECPQGLVCSAVTPGDCFPCLEHAEACVLDER